MTKIIKTEMNEAAEIIRGGGLVAVPTETVYGLAGNGLDENAVQKIYEVKGRPAVKPLALMVPDASAMELYCEAVPQSAKYLAEKFWPGPLTIVLKAKDLVPDIVRAGGETVGLRCPDHPLTLEALRLAKLPFAAPSANPSGEQSPKNAQCVMEYFNGSIDAVIDGGECGIGLESTLILMSEMPYRILRQGALPEKEIAEALVDNMKIIGITGGTGCGKTTALRELEKRGAKILDCDAIYHEMLENSTALLAELEANFPGAFPEGEFNRKALGAIVFSDSEKLALLNSITHRHISNRIDEILREHAMNGAELAAIDAIELIGGGLAERCTTKVAVTAAREKRIERIMARDNISREYAEMRVDAQRPQEYFEANCEHVLVNNSTPDDFEAECRKLFEEIL